MYTNTDSFRLLFCFQFAVAILAVAGWTWLSQGSTRIVRWLLFASSCIIVFALVRVLLLPELPELYSHRQGLRLLWSDPTTPAPFEHRSFRTAMSFCFAVCGSIWTAIYLWSSRGRGIEPSRSLRVAFIALMLGDVGFVAYGFNPIIPAAIVFPEPPESLRLLMGGLDGGRMVATDEILVPNPAMVYGWHDLRGYDFPLDTRWATLFRRLGWIGQQASIVLMPHKEIAPCVRSELQSVLDKCSVQFVWTDGVREPIAECDQHAAIGSSPRWLRLALPSRDGSVFRNVTAYPRAYFPRSVAVVDAESALDALLDNSHDLRERSFVESEIGQVDSALDVTSQSASENATITLDDA